VSDGGVASHAPPDAGEFLAKRIERRQVETLIQKTEAEDAVDAGRRAQQELDDWFLSRAQHGGRTNEGASDEE
jgi:hypothetical protein